MVSSTAELATITPDQWRRRMFDLFADDCLSSRGSSPPAPTDRRPPGARHPTSRRWSRGPVVLIGDAVHAASASAGQDASLAIEDAVVLVKCLRDIPEHPHAFARYEKLLRERAEKVVAYARRPGSDKTPGPVARVFRDAMMPLVLRLTGLTSSRSSTNLDTK